MASLSTKDTALGCSSSAVSVPNRTQALPCPNSHRSSGAEITALQIKLSAQPFAGDTLFHVEGAEWKACPRSESYFHNLTNLRLSCKRLCAGIGLQAEARIHYSCSHRRQPGNSLRERTQVEEGGAENSFIRAGLPEPLENHMLQKNVADLLAEPV